MTGYNEVRALNREDPGRFVNEHRHSCGCQTVFDTHLWRSSFTRRCEYHREARP